VIATDAGGAVEEMVEGENGNIIPLGEDARPLQNAVKALLRDRSKLSNFKNPHKHMIRTYDEQAEELHRFLSGISAAHRPNDSAELS
jgi:glycosyltransferase involved in cell wall biosynthesis